MKISKQDFHAYETVRLSGVTNMYAITTVQVISGLDKPVIPTIQQADYAALREKYGVPESVEEAAEELGSEYA